ncbi:MAG TPA: sterol desaturase family protein [Acidimicrobiales bacterium]
MNARRLAIGGATLALLLVALRVRSGIVFGLVVLVAIFVPMEKLFALHPRKTLRDRWKTDAVHFVVNNMLITVGLVVALVVSIVALHWMVNPDLRAAVASQPGWLQFLEAVLVADLAQYWAHRANHEVPLLWRFHKVHHSIEEMDWLAAGRLHPIDSVFTRAAAILPLYVLGFSRATFGGYLVFTAFMAIFIHANVRFRFGPLRWVTATPEFHHWHHALAPVNKNYAGQLPLLDVVFGTCHLPTHQMPAAYGIRERIPDGYLAQLAWPFKRATPFEPAMPFERAPSTRADRESAAPSGGEAARYPVGNSA